MHASWQIAPASLANELRQLGLPCQPTTSDALPATADLKTTTVGVFANAADVDTSLAEAGSSTDPIAGDVKVAKASAEEANTKELVRHQGKLQLVLDTSYSRPPDQ